MLIHYDGMKDFRTSQDLEHTKKNNQPQRFDFARPSVYTRDYKEFKVHEIIYLLSSKGNGNKTLID